MCFRTGVMLAAALLAAGCGIRCNPSTDLPHCDGNTLISCPSPGVDQFTPVVLQHKDCEDLVCVARGGQGFCALSATPAPACDGGSEPSCDSATTRLFCAQGFGTSRSTCIRCEALPDAGQACVGGPGSPCAQDADCATGLACHNQFCFAS